jgi:DoxX
MGLFRLLARTTIGLLFVGHGTQKLFGWFGGGGLDGTGGFFEQLGLDRGATTPWPPVPPKPVVDFSSPSAPSRRSVRRRSRAR